MNRVQNFTPITYATNQLAGQKRRRMRPAVSCDPCRQRKSKCNKAQPCNACTQRNRKDGCVYGRDSIEKERGEEHGELRNAHATVSTPGHEYSENRMIRLESKVEELQDALRKLASELHARPLSGSAANGIDATNGAEELEDLSSAEPKEDQRLGLRQGKFASRQGVLHYIGPTGWTIHRHDVQDRIHGLFMRIQAFDQWNTFMSLRSLYQGWRIPSLLDWVSAPLSAVSVPDLVAMLPQQADCEVLARCFFNTFNRIYPIIDEETFLDEMSEFWNSKTPPSNTWLASMLAVIAIGLLVPIYELPTNTKVVHGRATGKKLLRTAMQFLMSNPPLFRRPDTRVFQTLLLTIFSRKLELSEPDGSDAINGILAMARQMAFSMGLHRNPSTIVDDIANGSLLGVKRKACLQDVALRRKMWICFLLLDIEHSVQSGMPFLLRPNDSEASAESSFGMDAESRYLYCINAALPVWAEVIQATNGCNDRPSVSRISLLNSLLHNLGDTIDEHIPPPDHCSSFESVEEASVYLLRRAVLHCLTNRMMMIVHGTLTLDSSSPAACESTLAAGIDIQNHAHAIKAQATQLPIFSQEAWVHFIVAVAFCQIAYANSHIMIRIRRILSGHDQMLSLKISTRHGRQEFDLTSLLDSVEQSAGLCESIVHHSPSTIKWHMFFKCYCADIRERIQLTNESTLSSSQPDATAEDLESVAQAMRQASEESLARSQRQVELAIAGNDPPPALCPVDKVGAEETTEEVPDGEKNSAGNSANPNTLEMTSGIAGADAMLNTVSGTATYLFGRPSYLWVWHSIMKHQTHRSTLTPGTLAEPPSTDLGMLVEGGLDDMSLWPLDLDWWTDEAISATGRMTDMLGY